MTIDLTDNAPRVSYTVSQGATQTSFTVPFEFFDAVDGDTSELSSKLFNDYKNTITNNDYVNSNLLYITKKSTFAISTVCFIVILTGADC